MRWFGALALGALLLAPTAAHAGGRVPGKPPALCAGDIFADDIGTAGNDTLQAADRPQRLWGLGGDDRLLGSATRASCLFGGAGNDVLSVGLGGGLAMGEGGNDFVIGGVRDDVLLGGAGNDTLHGGDGADVIDGGSGTDEIDAGPGDDHVTADDGRAEIVNCGPGDDIAKADRIDVTLSCETLLRKGPSLPVLVTSPRQGPTDTTLRGNFRVPETAPAGAYRVLLVTGALSSDCTGGPLDIAHLGRVRRGQTVRVTILPPVPGWCPGIVKAAMVLHPRCTARGGCAAPPPAQPVARLAFHAEAQPYALPTRSPSGIPEAPPIRRSFHT